MKRCVFAILLFALWTGCGEGEGGKPASVPAKGEDAMARFVLKEKPQGGAGIKEVIKEASPEEVVAHGIVGDIFAGHAAFRLMDPSLLKDCTDEGKPWVLC